MGTDPACWGEGGLHRGQWLDGGWPDELSAATALVEEAVMLETGVPLAAIRVEDPQLR
jgi:hypothetical protein